MAAFSTDTNAFTTDGQYTSPQTRQQSPSPDLWQEDTTASTFSDTLHNNRDSSPQAPSRDSNVPLLQEDSAVNPPPGESDTAAPRRAESVPLRKVTSTRDKAPRRSQKRLCGAHDSVQKWVSRHSWWPWEVGYWLCSLAFLFAIIIVLAVFDSRKLPQWRFGITVNTLVSVFSTINILLLTITISAGMGQAKWIWFGRRARPLVDFDIIDDASKGPAGSVVLLLRRRGGHLAIIGACLTILLLAVGPFVQQIIAFESRPVSELTASIPVAQNYSTYATDEEQNSLSVDMKAAVLNGALTTSALEYKNTPSCATGNCTWSNYQSLAVCSSCAVVDNTELGKILEMNVTLAEEVAAFLVIPSWNPFQTNTSYAEKITPTIAFPDHGTLIADVFLIDPWKAFECILEFCVKTYNASVENGNFVETEIDSVHQRGPTTMIESYDRAAYGASWELPALNFTNGDVGVHYIDPMNTYYLSQYINSTFAGSTGNAPDTSNGFESQMQSTSDVVEAFYTLMVDDATSTNSTPNVIFDNTAQSMTKVIRATAHANDGSQNTLAIGQSLHNETFISVRWLWLILPAGVQLFALMFLIAIIHLTRRAGLEAYKDGVLPVLLQGIDEESRRNMGRLSLLSDMDAVAEETEMILVDRPSTGWSLSTVMKHSVAKAKK